MRAVRALARAWVVAACGLTAAHAQPFPEPADPKLQRGRAVWLGTCRDCHANSLADAPQVKNRDAWAARLAQGRAALYASAIKGKTGKGDSEMPPRGGNGGLSDDEVRVAVDYMVFLVQDNR